VTQLTEQEIAVIRGEAATRIFELFNNWLAPGRMYCIEMTATGRVAVRLTRPDGTVQIFHGSDVQDACAQAAQTLWCDEEEP